MSDPTHGQQMAQKSAELMRKATSQLHDLVKTFRVEPEADVESAIGAMDTTPQERDAIAKWFQAL